MDILKIAQQQVGAIVPGRTPDAGTVTLYARHANNLADGLITILPEMQLSRALRALVLKSNWEFKAHAGSFTILSSKRNATMITQSSIL